LPKPGVANRPNANRATARQLYAAKTYKLSEEEAHLRYTHPAITWSFCQDYCKTPKVPYSQGQVPYSHTQVAEVAELTPDEQAEGNIAGFSRLEIS
jgi:hypothetical protein